MKTFKLYVYLSGEWAVFSFHTKGDRPIAIAKLNRSGIEWTVRD